MNGSPVALRVLTENGRAQSEGFPTGFLRKRTWPLGEYRWDGAGGSFYFVDPQDDLLVVCMVQAPTQGGRIQLALKTMMFEALGRGLRKD
jgi:CubicO group peptidase (beta-lactamase class C family)